MAYKVFLGGDPTTAGNWSPSGVPSDGDDVVIDGRCVSALTGADQSAIEPATLRIYKSCSFDIGSIGTPWQIGPALCEIGLPSENAGVETGPTTIALDFTSDQVNLIVHDTADGADGFPSVIVRGTHASNVMTIKGGKVGIGTLFPGEATTVATLNVSGDKSNVVIGFGVTLTTYNHKEGAALLQCAATTLNIDSGTVETRGSGAITTVQARGTFISNSTGTITNLNIAGNGIADFSQSPIARAVTNAFMYGNGCTLNIDNNAYAAGAPVVTFTNGIDTLKGAKNQQILGLTDLTTSFTSL